MNHPFLYIQVATTGNRLNCSTRDIESCRFNFEVHEDIRDCFPCYLSIAVRPSLILWSGQCY